MDLMDFLGQLTNEDLTALAKGTISGDMRYELQAAEVVTNDRDLIKAAKAVFKFREKSEAAETQAETAAEAEKAAAEKAEAAAEAVLAVRQSEQVQAPAPGNAPDQEQEPAPEVTAKPQQVKKSIPIRDRLALASAMLDINQKIETFKDAKRALERDYNNGIRGANDRFTIGQSASPFTSTNPEFVNALYKYLINHMESRINEMEEDLNKFEIDIN